jgi:hypothetical protein
MYYMRGIAKMEDSDEVFKSITARTDVWRDMFLESQRFASLSEEQAKLQ